MSTLPSPNDRVAGSLDAQIPIRVADSISGCPIDLPLLLGRLVDGVDPGYGTPRLTLTPWCPQCRSRHVVLFEVRHVEELDRVVQVAADPASTCPVERSGYYAAADPDLESLNLGALEDFTVAETRRDLGPAGQV